MKPPTTLLQACVALGGLLLVAVGTPGCKEGSSYYPNGEPEFAVSVAATPNSPARDEDTYQLWVSPASHSFSNARLLSLEGGTGEVVVGQTVAGGLDMRVEVLPGAGVYEWHEDEAEWHHEDAGAKTVHIAVRLGASAGTGHTTEEVEFHPGDHGPKLEIGGTETDLTATVTKHGMRWIWNFTGREVLASASGTVTSVSSLTNGGADFVTAGVQAGDLVQITASAGTTVTVGGNAATLPVEVPITAVLNSTTLSLQDAVQVDGADGTVTYSIQRGPFFNNVDGNATGGATEPALTGTLHEMEVHLHMPEVSRDQDPKHASETDMVRGEVKLEFKDVRCFNGRFVEWKELHDAQGNPTGIYSYQESELEVEVTHANGGSGPKLKAKLESHSAKTLYKDGYPAPVLLDKSGFDLSVSLALLAQWADHGDDDHDGGEDHDAGGSDDHADADAGGDGHTDDGHDAKWQSHNLPGFTVQVTVQNQLTNAQVVVTLKPIWSEKYGLYYGANVTLPIVGQVTQPQQAPEPDDGGGHGH